jgi:hypothetical protein
MSQDEFLALLKQHPPKDAGTCAGYLKDKVQRARLCFQRTPYADRIERLVEHRQIFTTVFFPRLLMVLLWMSSYEDAAMAVLDLCVYTKMDCLHARVPFFTGEDHQLAHRELDGILRVTLRSIQHSQRYYRRYTYTFADISEASTPAYATASTPFPRARRAYLTIMRTEGVFR